MVTREDVAKKAGVSVTAVSRVINNSGYVKQEKREAILAAIREVGYCPKAIPILNPRPELKQILFLNRDPGNSFTLEIYKGLVDYAWTRKYMVSLSGTWQIEQIQNMMVSGVVLSNEVDALEFNRTFGATLPLPVVAASHGASFQQPKQIPYVECDTYAAMEVMLDYLMEKGHRKIAFASPFLVNEGNPRGIAYYSRMRPILGRGEVTDYIFCAEEFMKICEKGEIDFFHVGELLAARMLEQGCDATAVACFNDEIALGMMKRFRERKISVPEDISIMGMDGIQVGRYVHPSLTTVPLSAYEQGRKCAQLLLDMIEDKKVPRRSRIRFQPILEGGSVREIRPNGG